MTKSQKPREEPKFRVDDLEKKGSNLYQKQWPKEDAEPTSMKEEDDELGSDEMGGILEHPSYKELELKLTEAEEKANEHWNQQLRVQAELDNFRRRAERDVAQAHKFALEKFVSELLPVIDSLEAALSCEVGENEFARKIHEGIELTRALFIKSLEKFGVEQINPMGELFNPEFHQAIATQQRDGVPSNTIVEILQKGYLLNGRLVRPALVVVAMS